MQTAEWTWLEDKQILMQWDLIDHNYRTEEVTLCMCLCLWLCCIALMCLLVMLFICAIAYFIVNLCNCQKAFAALAAGEIVKRVNPKTGKTLYGIGWSWIYFEFVMKCNICLLLWFAINTFKESAAHRRKIIELVQQMLDRNFWIMYIVVFAL